MSGSVKIDELRNRTVEFRKEVSEENIPQFGRSSKDSRGSATEKTYEELRREKKERDNKTHDSLISIKEDIDKLKETLERSKSRERTPKNAAGLPIKKDLRVEDSYGYTPIQQQVSRKLQSRNEPQTLNSKGRDGYDANTSNKFKTNDTNQRDSYGHSAQEDIRPIDYRGRDNTAPVKMTPRGNGQRVVHYPSNLELMKFRIQSDILIE